MSSPLLTELERIVGAAHVRRGEAERIAYASDMWPRNQIWKLQGEPARHPPDVVVHPADEAQVAQIHAAALRHSVPLIPYGAGSGVCGGTVPIRGGIVMDLRRLRRLVSVDDHDLLVTVEAGMIGMQLEEELDARGYTLGHFPSSILCSTVGGWVAARSAGQYSSKYGKIEDMLVRVRAVMPDGQILETGPEDGVNLSALLLGSEGTLATITQATLRVHPKPEARAFRGYRYQSLESGLRAVRALMQSGLAPCLVRLYDPFDTVLHRSDKPTSAASGDSASLEALQDAFSERSRPAEGPVSRLAESAKRMGTALALGNASWINRIGAALGQACLLVVGFEGQRAVVDADMRAAQALLASLGGVDGGDGPGLRWFEHRYHVSFKQSRLYGSGAFADTLEVSATWARVAPVYDAVRAAVAPHALIMAHFSHAYREGCSIYFTFAAHRRDPKALERLYDRVLHEAFSAVLREGGSVSHHHGVGIGKRDQMAREHGAGIRLLYGVKDAWDPAAFMNPGKVLPDRAVTQ